MRTRSQSRNNFPQQEASRAIVEPLRIELPLLEDQFQEDPPEDPPEVPMDDNRTMAELLQPPTEGYEDAIVIPKVAADNFELKHGLINLFFTPSKTTNLCNEITRFQQRFDESFYEVWDHFNDLLRACPRHGFFELHQLDTFYNALNVNDQDTLNSTAGDKRNQSSAPAPSPTPAPVKAVEPNFVTCGSAHSYQNWSRTLPSNTINNSKEDLKGITTRSGVAYQGPTIPTSSKVVKQGTEVTKDQVQTLSSQSTTPVQPLVVQSET
nr:reverse transcriptase domain-containing protein [Tanacetum cinerariifolium]